MRMWCLLHVSLGYRYSYWPDETVCHVIAEEIGGRLLESWEKKSIYKLDWRNETFLVQSF